MLDVKYFLFCAVCPNLSQACREVHTVLTRHQNPATLDDAFVEVIRSRVDPIDAIIRAHRLCVLAGQAVDTTW